MIPKTEKLAKEEIAACHKEKPCSKKAEVKSRSSSTMVIKKIKMLNEFIAVRLFEHESELALPDDKRFRNEGVVVGIGPGLPDGAGGRCASQLNIGDVVLVQERNVLTSLNVSGHPYDDAKIVVLSEKNIICKLEPVKFEVID